MDLSTTTAANVVALLLGLVGIGIAILPIIREHRASRHARIIVSLEKLFRADANRLQERLRIENLGPSPARNLTVESIGEPPVVPDEYRPAFEWWLPVEVLQPGQDYVLLVEPSMADVDPPSVVLTWEDKADAKRKQFALSPKYL